MAFTLYDATIPTYLQILGAVSGLVAKAEQFCADHALEPDALLQARLADDMLPFAYQVKSVAAHSIGAIEGVRQGVFSPDMTPPPATFDGLTATLDAAVAALQALDPDEVNGFIGGAMRFEIGTAYRLDFTAEAFLLSFSQPNFHFHAATAYDILRMKGVKIGKRDYLGAMRKLD